MMRKKICALMTMLVAVNMACAQEQAWISDQLRTSVNDNPGMGAGFVGSLSAGEAVTVLNRSEDGDYLEVKTDELQGWVAARNIIFTPSIHAKYAELQTQLNTLNAQTDSTEQSRQNSADIISQLQDEMNELRQSEAEAQADLVAIKRISGNAVAMDERNRELQTTVVDLEQKNLALRHQNARLQDQISNRELYVGGGLVALGFILHWLAGLLRVNRREARFDDF